MLSVGFRPYVLNSSCSLLAQKLSPKIQARAAVTEVPVAFEAPMKEASDSERRSLVNSVEAFIFDCDGVIWRGDTLIEGVPETLDMLRDMGKKLIFVTNNSTKSREGYKAKFTKLGLTVRPEEIYSSSFAAAAYLESTKFPKEKKVYVVGEVGIQEELDLLGFQHLGGPADGAKVPPMGKGEKVEVDPNIGAVIVGFDRNINYYKIQYATVCLRELPSCEFIATNMDAVTHLTDAQEWAGNGSMLIGYYSVLWNKMTPRISRLGLFSFLKNPLDPDDRRKLNPKIVIALPALPPVGAIKGSSQREPTVVGKPAGFMLDDIADKFQLDPKQICMVGDRLDTDVMFGKKGGLTTLLVLSGVTTEEELQNDGNTIHPDYYTSQLPDLLCCKK